MIDTVYVLGAGASNEVKLPLGAGLKSDIATRLDIQYDDTGRRVRGDALLADSLRHIAHSQKLTNENEYLHAAWRIRDAMPLAQSIDQYLDSHRDDRTLELVGKLAIVRAILDAEKKSSLYFDTRRVRGLAHGALQVTWYNAFWQRFSEGCTRDQLLERAESIAFIDFNYDRCLQHFLLHAFQSFYGADATTAADVVKRIIILHPYGSIGALPWVNRQGSVMFGTDASAQQLSELASSVRTFAQGSDPAASDIIDIRRIIDEAERIVFLGFAFHRQNLQLLWPHRATDIVRNRRIFGTAVNVSAADIASITVDISLKSRIERNHILLHDSKCFDLFHHYHRDLSFSRPPHANPC